MIQTPTMPARDSADERVSADWIFDVMMGEIISGTLPPGAKLNEPALARRFGVNRGPLREAIRRLQGRDLVVCRPNAGARVIVHSPKQVLDTYEMREALESFAARLAAQNMSEEDIAALKRTVLAGRDGQDSDDIRTGFHYQIVLGSQNNAICGILDINFFMLLRLWRTKFGWLNHSGSDSWVDHSRIADAIAFRDAESAELLMRNHLKRLRGVILENLRRQGDDASSSSLA